MTDYIFKRILLCISILVFAACKSPTDFNQIEQREHGLSYIKGTDSLMDGEAIRKFDNGRIAERTNYEKGKPIGNWYAYGYDGEIVSHGFGIDAKKYQQKFSDFNLANSFLSINIEGSFAFATLYIDDTMLFKEPKALIDLSKEIFSDYSDKYKIDDILSYDKGHEYTISKSATLSNDFRIDTVSDNDKRKVHFK